MIICQGIAELGSGFFSREVTRFFTTGIFIAEEQTDTVGFLSREVTVSFAIGFISSPYYFDSYRYCHDKQTDEEAGTGKFGVVVFHNSNFRLDFLICQAENGIK